MLTCPSSARSKPATIRNNVVLPLPEEPRMAVNEPAGHGQLHPAQDGLGPEGLGDAGDAKVFHVDIILVGNSAPGVSGPGAWAAAPIRPGWRSNQRPSTYPGTAAMSTMTAAYGAAWE